MNSVAVGQPRRAFALVAVLIVMGSALLVATGLIFMTQAEVAGSAGAFDRAQSRALAWSGLQALMADLDEQRQTILDGRAARLDERYVIYEEEAGLGVVRLLAIGPDGEHLVPEAGKLDLSRLDAEMLVATGLVDDALAEAVISYRDGRRPLQSVAELLEVPGMSAETLYGPLADLVSGDSDGPAGAGFGGGTTIGAGPRGLADVVTVYGVEPAIQRNGRLRINLNVEWSDELGDRVSRRFGRDLSEMLRQIIQGGTTFDTEATLFEVLRFFEVAPDEWPEIIDTFTAESGDFHFGRLDINTAPYEALVALPGLEPEQAAEIVQSRDDLGDEERATIAWPAFLGIVEAQAYDQLAGRITTRSWTYRLRLAAGEEDPDDPGAPLRHAVIYEAVIDLSAPRPRVAYLREMTLFDITVLVASNTAPDEDGFDEEVDPGGDVEGAGDAPDAEPGGDAGLDAAGEDPFADPAMEPSDAQDQPATAAPAPVAAASERRIGRWQGGR